MNDVSIFGVRFSVWLVVPLTYFVYVTLFLFIKRAGFSALQRMAKNTKTNLDDVFIGAADFPLTLLIFTSGGVVIEPMIPQGSDVDLTKYILIGFKATTIVAIILFADRFINRLFKEYSHQVEILRSTGGIARGFVRLIVIGLGILILLDSFGVSITPLIASLGIGSLAVALALQPTLENFFSGIQLVIDKPIQVGHFIRLESGEEGYVDKIGWRSSWIRQLANNMIVIPNKTLVNSKVVNYYYPDTQTAVLAQVSVHYESDLEHVERVTMEVATEVMTQVPGGVEDFKPFIRYHTFADFSINFTVIMRGKEFVDQYLIIHEFIKRLHKRYSQEGIVIPYPIEAVNYDQEHRFSKNDDPMVHK